MPSNFSSELQKATKKSMQHLTTKDLAIQATASFLGCAHISNTLRRQSNSYYSDGRRLTPAENIAFGLSLISSAISLVATSAEMASRQNGNPVASPEPDKTTSNQNAIIASRATKLLLVLIEVAKGQTLVKKRYLSSVGRAYGLLAAVIIADDLRARVHYARN